MRWIKKGSKKPTRGDARIKTWFALWPVTLNNEVRWLERVKVLQKFDEYITGHGGFVSGWENIRFLN
jgi:hypothetical protein